MSTLAIRKTAQPAAGPPPAPPRDRRSAAGSR
ncbi:hypothetical protein SGLAM104S_08381 [Streptomyces glaucescens]